MVFTKTNQLHKFIVSKYYSYASSPFYKTYPIDREKGVSSMKNMLCFGVFAVIGIMLLAIPVSADPICRPVLSEGSDFVKGTFGADFDYGKFNEPGWSQNDIWWDQEGSGTTVLEMMMVPQNGATIVNLGVVDFDAITRLQLRQLTAYSTTPIYAHDNSANQLINGDVFAVLTQDGNYAKVKVLNYGYDITLQWVTFDKYCYNNIPEFPSMFLPASMIIGFLGAILLIQRTREQ
jgi:hypothetical protein